MSYPPDVDGAQTRRIRRVLRDTTHYKNTEEFFSAILLMTGKPPIPLDRDYLYGSHAYMKPGWDELLRWREAVIGPLNEWTHHSINPSFLMKEYLEWLMKNQESSNS